MLKDTEGTKVVYCTESTRPKITLAALRWMEKRGLARAGELLDNELLCKEQVGWAYLNGIDRHDPILVACVEELGSKAWWFGSELMIEVVHGAYFIDEVPAVSGNVVEAVVTPDSVQWVFVGDAQRIEVLAADEKVVQVDHGPVGVALTDLSGVLGERRQGATLEDMDKAIADGAVDAPHVMRISATHILHLLRKNGHAVPEDAMVTFRVPGGGDWSNSDLSIEEFPIQVQWK
jgi:hypothetical protein